jgi:RNA polymerase sigma factor (sigma-70 family)
MIGDTSKEISLAALDPAKENERLVASIAAGDRDAEQAFALRFMRPVRAMLLARLRNPDIAADLLQDVMVESISALRKGQVREPAKLPGFVASVARNVLNSHFRGAARQPESLELPEDLQALKLEADPMEEEQRESRAIEAISSLESVDRSILQMTLVDGLKPAAIATRLGLNPDVVRQRKLRATRKIIDLVNRLSQTGSVVHLTTGRRT